MGTTNDTLLPFEHKSTDYQGYKEKIYLTTKSGIYLTEIGVAWREKISYLTKKVVTWLPYPIYLINIILNYQVTIKQVYQKSSKSMLLDKAG